MNQGDETPPRWKRWCLGYWSATKKPLATALGLSAFAIAIRGGVTAEWGVKVWHLVVTYVVIALFVGLIIFLFSSWASNRWRAALLGSIAGAMIAVVFNHVMGPIVFGARLDLRKIWDYIAALGVFGGYLGLIIWQPSEVPPVQHEHRG
jgi:hypothetical protein